MKVCNERVRVAKTRNVKPWNERRGHCDHDPLRDSVPHIAGVNMDEVIEAVHGP